MALGVAEWGRLGRRACACADHAERRKDDDSQLHLEENILWLVQTERLSIATRQALMLMLLTAVARHPCDGILPNACTVRRAAALALVAAGGGGDGAGTPLQVSRGLSTARDAAVSPDAT